MTDRVQPLGIVERWRHQRLSLAGFSPRARAALLVGLAFAALSAALLLEEAIPLTVPFKRLPLDLGNDEWTLEPLLVVGVATAAEACGLFLLVCALDRRGPGTRIATTAALGFPGAMLMVNLATDSTAPTTFRVCGGVVTAGVVGAVMISSRRNSPTWAAGALAAAPWCVASAGAVWPMDPLNHMNFVGYVFAVADQMDIVIAVAFLWQLLEGVNATVAGPAMATMHLVRRRREAFAAFVAIVVAWLTAGFAGILPARLGGHASEWESMRHAVWLWPWVIAIAALLVLLERRSVVGTMNEHTARAVLVFGVAWEGVRLVGSGTWLASFAFPWNSSARGRAQQISMRVADQTNRWHAILIVLALLFGLVLLRTPARRSQGVMLVLLGLWSLPTAWTLARGEYAPVGSAGKLLMLNVALVVIVVALTVIRTTKGMSPRPGDVLFLVVFTILGAAGPLSSIGSTIIGHAIFYLGLVFGPLWTFAFGARNINVKNGGSPQVLIALVGVAALTLGLALFDVSVGLLSAGSGMGEVGGLRLILVVPCAGILSLAAASSSSFR